jgi:hypothetical protein
MIQDPILQVVAVIVFSYLLAGGIVVWMMRGESLGSILRALSLAYIVTSCLVGVIGLFLWIILP